MNLTHWMRKENSGLAYTTLELVEEEERQGHGIRVHEPSQPEAILSKFDGPPDLHLIHSQLGMGAYHDGIPKVMWMHGEPLGSVANGMSMRAIVNLAPSVEAFICMRQEEWPIWNSIKRTYLVPKGIDLIRFTPVDGVEKLSGNPAILYYENWRGERNPLILCRALVEVVKRFPEAHLHLYNCPGGKMLDTFLGLSNHCRWYTFLKTIHGKEDDVVTLLNRADIVVSCLDPLYARGIEAFGCGKAFIGPGYREHDYPWTCDLEVHSMADAIIRCWSDYGRINYRQWAEQHHDVAKTVRQSLEVYQRFL